MCFRRLDNLIKAARNQTVLMKIVLGFFTGIRKLCRSASDVHLHLNQLLQYQKCNKVVTNAEGYIIHSLLAGPWRGAFKVNMHF